MLLFTHVMLHSIVNGAAKARIIARIIGWGIRFKLQMLCPQEDE